jgi:HK97 gp10 family phage protein
MNVDIDVTFTDNLSGYSDRVLRRLSGVVRKNALKVERNAKKSIQTGTKSGRTYKRGTRTHQASAPGEAPATDTANLVNSVQTQMNPGALEATITVGAEYAADLEYGTRTMDARPFMTPAAEKVRPDFLADCEQVLREEA